MVKPIIRFYEPYEIIVLVNNEIMSYLDVPQFTENQMLEKYNIDYYDQFSLTPQLTFVCIYPNLCH